VWAIDGDTLRRVPVRTGISDGELTAVGPETIKAGSQVVVELTPEGRKAYGVSR
jgi:hypothetical protein